MDAARRDTVVLSNDLATDPRWPRFAAAAADNGIRSALSFTLFTTADIETGLDLATHAAIALHTANKTEQFTSALASRDLIGQAKRMVMERYGIYTVQAFFLLSKLSQDSNTPLVRLAADLIALGSETRTPPR